MLVKILLSPLLESRVREAEQILTRVKLTQQHPDVLWFPDHSKLGVEQAKAIREHLSLKPYSAKNRAVVIENAQNFTPDAQNALLKTLEEPPESAVLILCAESENSFLPTILSRCQVIRLPAAATKDDTKYINDITQLMKSSIEERFEYIEKLDDKAAFLQALIEYFRNDLASHPGGVNLKFAKILLEAEEWVKSNGNIRTTLEYLMLKIP